MHTHVFAGDSARGVSYRYTGLILNVVAEYQNWEPFHWSLNPHYIYRVKRAPGVDYEVLTPIYTNYPTNRILLTRHGIELTVTVGGIYHKVNALQILLAIGTFLSIVGTVYNVSKVLLRLLAKKCCFPHLRHTMVRVVSLEKIAEDGVQKPVRMNTWFKQENGTLETPLLSP
jgi:hypothetical protein